ncbi:MAG: glycosyltransferase family 2 protein, partial [Candidatus Promineifilaceae bacterium]
GPAGEGRPTLSTVIVSWNVRDLLARCLDSLRRELLAWPELSSETFVVDNASSDGSPALVRGQYSWARLLTNEANVGFAEANNQAIRLSRGQYILLLNPDTELRPGALNALLVFMQSRPGVGMAGARLLNPDGSLQRSCYRQPSLAREFLLMFHLDALASYGSYRMEKWDLTRPRQVDSILGACMLIPGPVLEQVGLLDSNYFMYSEEVDLCQRVRQAGYPIYWVPQAQITHFWGGSSAQVADNMFEQLYRSKLRFYRKFGGRGSGRLYKLILFAAGLARLALSPFTLFEGPASRKRHCQLTRRYGRLLRALPSF